jgi:FAD/FMN-containing dehydrogenase/Fe-S oxidoreductase
MDQERERIQADLRGLLDGEVRCDDLFVELYSVDASIYELRPLGVVRPLHLADVVACVRYAAENGISLHARGAGSGLAGESLGRGLIVDFSHAMRRILATDEQTVRVQPGVVCALLNQHLAGRGRMYGPDPANASVTTVGGMVARDAAGSHRGRYGSARDTVVSLQVVLADGSIIEAGEHTLQQASPAGAQGSRRDILIRQLASVLRRESGTIQRHWPRAPINGAGYGLPGVLSDQRLKLARLLAGSEGTLGLITEATLRTEPRPACIGAALLFFDRLESAARGAQEVAQLDATACELMDRRLLTIAREMDRRYESLIPPGAEAMLLVEFQGSDQDQVRRRLHDLVGLLQRRKRLALDQRLALEAEEVALFWGLPRRVVHGLYRLRGASRALPFVEDVAVPPAVLPEFLVQLQNVLKTHEVTASLLAHAAIGQLQLRPFLDLGDPRAGQTMQALATDLYEKVLDAGGTISGQNADGLSRTWFLPKQYGPVYRVFRQVKEVFDPQNILNPEKIVAHRPQQVGQNLRRVWAPVNSDLQQPAGDEAREQTPVTTIGSLQLGGTGEPITLTARNCNGCALCRTQLPDARMCPIFRYGPREEATPRAKATLMRAVLTGRLDPAALATDEMKRLADLCVHCHQCRLECPAGVDVARLMAECKGQYVAINGLPPTTWFFARIDRVAWWGCLLHPLSNWAIQNRQARWVIERTLGVAQGRKLPRFARRSFTRLAHRRKLHRPTRRGDRKVLLFVDVYANWFDLQLAEALVAILQHNGISVYVPMGQMQSGMAAVSIGAIGVARKLALHNVRLLAEAVRQGYEIVTPEPAAALCLSREYPHLVDEEDCRLVAQHTSEACDYLWRLHQAGNLDLNLKPLSFQVGYHQPCHSRALEMGTPGYQLLRLIPGLVVRLLDAGCSGMAGTYGLQRANYRSSLRAGWKLISHLRDPAIQAGATECSSCKMQMEQGNTKPTIHPLKILALSYGLMPEISRLLTTRGQELVVT